MVADLPSGVVVDVDVFRDGDGFGEVDHPDGGAPLVVDEEEGATDQLVGPEEVRFLDCCADAL